MEYAVQNIQYRIYSYSIYSTEYTIIEYTIQNIQYRIYSYRIYSTEYTIIEYTIVEHPVKNIQL